MNKYLLSTLISLSLTSSVVFAEEAAAPAPAAEAATAAVEASAPAPVAEAKPAAPQVVAPIIPAPIIPAPIAAPVVPVPPPILNHDEIIKKQRELADNMRKAHKNYMENIRKFHNVDSRREALEKRMKEMRKQMDEVRNSYMKDMPKPRWNRGNDNQGGWQGRSRPQGYGPNYWNAPKAPQAAVAPQQARPMMRKGPRAEMREHHKNMETSLNNIETLLQKLVDGQAK